MDMLPVAVRFVGYADLLLLFGLAARWAVVPTGRPTGGRRLLIGLAGVGIIVSAVGLLVLAAGMAGAGLWPVDGAMLRMVAMETAVGWAFLVRLTALAVVVALLARPGAMGRVRRGGVAALAGIAAATLAWAGHAVMHDGVAGWVQLVADIVHLLAAAGWIGAIGWFLWRLRGPVAAVGQDLAAFAQTGTLLVAVLVATGVVNGGLLLGDVPVATVLTAPYGRLLLVKIMLFAAMLLVAAHNRWRLVPGLPTTGRALMRSLIMELALGILVLAAVAWLGTLSPSG